MLNLYWNLISFSIGFKLKEELKILNNYLKTNKLKSTKQRETILACFLKNKQHLTYKELYKLIKKKFPEIGDITVFRALKLFVKAGIAKKISFRDNKFRYEKIVNIMHHDHLECISCGKIIEIYNKNLESIQNKLCNDNLFDPTEHKLIIYGVCSECKTKESNKWN